MSTMRRQQRAIEGNTARKVQTLEYPSRERQPERRERRHAEKSNVQYVNVLYMIFLAAASCMVLWSCVNYLQLQAEDMGLGSCWVQLRERFTASGMSSNEYVHDVLDIHLQLQTRSIIAIGHKGMERKPFNEDNLQWEKIHLNKYGGK